MCSNFPPSQRLSSSQWSNLPLGLTGGGLSLSPVTGRGGSAGGPVTTVSLPAGGTSSSSGSAGGGEGSAGVTSTGGGGVPVLTGETGLDGGGANLVGAGDLGLLDGGVLVLLGLGVAVEVQVGHDVPLGLAGSEGAAQAEDLTGEHPPDETDGVATLVVGGDGNVDESVGESRERAWIVSRARSSVAKYNDGDVDVAEASLMAWASVRGSVTMIRRGSLNERVM